MEIGDNMRDFQHSFDFDYAIILGMKNKSQNSFMPMKTPQDVGL